MARPVGYYVHHQGAGHLHRARLIAGALPRPCTLIGTSVDPGNKGISSLPDDRIDGSFDGVDGVSSRPEALHYTPLNHAGVRTRMAAIAAWVASHDPALMIVDVSVEVAFFIRLLSSPLLLVRLAGRRDDQPHLEAFRIAEALIAPFPAAFEDPTIPAWIRDKTVYAGFLTTPMGTFAPSVGGEIAVVLGRGSGPMDVRRFAEAARVTPDWMWHIHGDTSGDQSDLPANLLVHGWTDEIGAALDRAEIIIGGAGDGLLAAVAARARRFICLPESRAFDEQVSKTVVLKDENLAVVLPHWPTASSWPAILLRAMTLDPRRLHTFYDSDAVPKVAAKIETICLNLTKGLGGLHP